jgi:hypothetical protein
MPHHRHDAHANLAPRDTIILRNVANGLNQIENLVITKQDLINAIYNEEAFKSLNLEEKKKLLRQLPNEVLFQVMAILPVELRKAEALSRNEAVKKAIAATEISRFLIISYVCIRFYHMFLKEPIEASLSENFGFRIEAGALANKIFACFALLLGSAITRANFEDITFPLQSSSLNSNFVAMGLVMELIHYAMAGRSLEMSSPHDTMQTALINSLVFLFNGLTVFTLFALGTRDYQQYFGQGDVNLKAIAPIAEKLRGIGADERVIPRNRAIQDARPQQALTAER